MTAMRTPTVTEIGRPDQDRINEVCMNLALRHGDLEIEPIDPNGSVRLVMQDEPYRSWRVTAQNRLIAEPRRQWGNAGRRTKAPRSRTTSYRKAPR